MKKYKGQIANILASEAMILDKMESDFKKLDASKMLEALKDTKLAVDSFQKTMIDIKNKHLKECAK